MKKDIPDLAGHLSKFLKLAELHKKYKESRSLPDIDDTNKKQHTLSESFTPYFISLHEMMKSIDKKVRKYEKEHKKSKELKWLKNDIEKLHKTIREAESFFTHINWLQERFPEAQYEDVTGLCKLASLEDVKEQDYSLNPGRYVGVVIEVDGKTEEEFIDEMVKLNDELEELNKEAKKLEEVISHNMKKIIGEEL